jgi:hypothetical protein
MDHTRFTSATSDLSLFLCILLPVIVVTFKF